MEPKKERMLIETSALHGVQQLHRAMQDEDWQDYLTLEVLQRLPGGEVILHEQVFKDTQLSGAMVLPKKRR